MRDRERLIARIRQVRGTSKGAEPPSEVAPALQPQQIRVLEERIKHLEALVQGLQDSVHRESSRHAERIAELEARIHPRALGKALSDDARARGL